MVSFVFIAATQYTIGMEEKTVNSTKYNVAWLPIKRYATSTDVQFKTYESSKTYYIGADSLNSPTDEITQNVNVALDYFRSLVNSNTITKTIYSEYATAYNFTPGNYNDVENICYIDAAGNKKYWTILPELTEDTLPITFYLEKPEEIFIDDSTIYLPFYQDSILWFTMGSGTNIYIDDKKANVNYYDYVKITTRGSSLPLIGEDVIIDVENYLDYKLSTIPQNNWITKGKFFEVMSNYSAFRNTHIGIVMKAESGALLVWCFYRFSVEGKITIEAQLPSGSSKEGTKDINTSNDYVFLNLPFKGVPSDIYRLTVEFNTTNGGKSYTYLPSDFKRISYDGKTYYYSKGPIGIFRTEYERRGGPGVPVQIIGNTYYYVPKWVNHLIILNTSTKAVINTKSINGSGDSDLGDDLPKTEFYKVSFTKNDFPLNLCYIICTASTNNDFTTNGTDIPDNAIYCYSWSDAADVK